MDYHKTLDEDAEIQASNDYLSDVQHVYASQQNAAKAALKDIHLVMRNKHSTGVYLKFSDFVRFVQDYADIVNDPLYGNNALEDRPNRSTLRKSVSSLPATAHIGDFPSKSDPGTTSNVQLSTGALCHLCLKDHKLYTCYKFRNMPIDQRCDYVKTNNLCTLCLSKNHPVSNCKSTYTCKVNNCGEKHSSSLHVSQNHTPIVGNCVKAFDKTNISMPTVPVLINGTLQTFALLDTGSSASF